MAEARMGLETRDAGVPQAFPNRRGRRILVAEDDASLRRLIADTLQGDGYDVIEAGDGVELLARIESMLALRSVRADMLLVIADINMPGLTGLDVLAILRCAFATTPVVLITAFGDQETLSEARELGAVAVLDKPFDLDRLREIVALTGWSR